MGELRPASSPTLQMGVLRPASSPTLQMGELRPAVSPTLQMGEQRPAISPPLQMGEPRPASSPTLQMGELRPASSPPLQMGELKPRVLNLLKVAGLDDSGCQAQTLTLLYTTSPYSKNCSELWHSDESSQRPAMCQRHYVTWECEQSWGHAYLSGCHHLQHRHTARSNEAGALGRGRMHRALRQHAEGHLTPTQGVRESFLKQMMLELHLKSEQKQPSKTI